MQTLITGFSSETVFRQEKVVSNFGSMHLLNLLYSTTVYFILVCGYGLVSLWLENSIYFKISVVFGLCFLLSGASIQFEAVMKREFKFKSVAIIDAVSFVSGSVVSIVAAILGAGVWALVVGAVAICLVKCVLRLSFSSWRWAINTNEICRISKFGLRYNSAVCVDHLSKSQLQLWTAVFFPARCLAI